MKTNLFFLILVLVGFLPQAGQALTGSEGRGGGDLCEDRIKQIRDDIKGWIIKGGNKALLLPPGVTSELYSSKMLQQIQAAKILCVGQGDAGFPVEVDRVPKVCRFDFNATSSTITCDIEKLNSTHEADQYVLIHHEYAGLAQLENPEGSDSSYGISNQISRSLTDQLVKKLAVLPSVVPVDVEGQWELVTGDEVKQLAYPLAAAIQKSDFGKCDWNIVDDEPEMGKSIWGDTSNPALFVPRLFSTAPTAPETGHTLYKNLSNKQPAYKAVLRLASYNSKVKDPLLYERSMYIFINQAGTEVEGFALKGFAEAVEESGPILKRRYEKKRYHAFEYCSQKTGWTEYIKEKQGYWSLM